jgi:hypothetical protein
MMRRRDCGPLLCFVLPVAALLFLQGTNDLARDVSEHARAGGKPMKDSTINDETNRQKFEENEAPDAAPEAAPEAAPNDQFIPFDTFNWDGIIADIDTLRGYGVPKYEAMKRVVIAFRSDFANRLHSELKARSTAAWKKETFARLKTEFEQEGI